VEAVNQFFTQEIEAGSLARFTTEKGKAYYQEDAWIWRIYLAGRRIDRALHGAVGQAYACILPQRIKH
jgi:hypothetical protein